MSPVFVVERTKEWARNAPLQLLKDSLVSIQNYVSVTRDTRPPVAVEIDLDLMAVIASELEFRRSAAYGIMAFRTALKQLLAESE